MHGSGSILLSSPCHYYMHFPFLSQSSTSPGLLLRFGNDNNNHSIRETTEEHVFNDESIGQSSGTPNIPCKMILPPSSFSHLCDEEICPLDGGVQGKSDGSGHTINGKFHGHSDLVDHMMSLLCQIIRYIWFEVRDTKEKL